MHVACTTAPKRQHRTGCGFLLEVELIRRLQCPIAAVLSTLRAVHNSLDVIVCEESTADALSYSVPRIQIEPVKGNKMARQLADRWRWEIQFDDANLTRFVCRTLYAQRDTYSHVIAARVMQSLSHGLASAVAAACVRTKAAVHFFQQHTHNGVRHRAVLWLCSKNSS